uniref:uncharacterized protein LOC117606432 isoform X1 n=1 Tax=Osmia lignaria TaxID=473952 RepID=UPI0014781085|nr:uncharacterized protein LOC117606432 isoform X1 [Osmia lignaria]XP_034184738.1 uncharacterized protein LOC117606432 isoform X1 [Osmia lignaria]XP_034184739.1 uncharacterized protein LOC117606432 isoform X1 [Osmia lignaria]XP_034184740.1 uncharacterized protein LOC117606432 isoform X1 [Osmia lignaria]XP_034184741.1 uncharacterized protein LOC117606432 isoform X1 [Osmia lignaria]
MVDLFEKDKGNISLSAKLQSWQDEKEKSKPTIINTQKAFYSIKIGDIQNKINRLEDRNDELLEKIEVTDERSAIIDAETTDEIANLSKQLYSQNNKVDDVKTKIDNVENNRIKDKHSHDDKVELLNQRYKEKKVELVSRIKVLTAKINGLEDFKKTQRGLEEKFERNEEEISKNEKEMKELLESVNRKFEFDKEMLKNEMYLCLLDLAAQFQVETVEHISLPNKRLMRENIMLKNELSHISKQLSSENDIQSILKNSVVDYRKNIVKKSLHVKENIITIKIQNALLKCLKNKFKSTKGYFSSIDVPDRAMESKYLMLIENARNEENLTNVRLSKLNVLLEKERTRIGIAKYLHRRLNCKIKAAVDTLYDLKYIARCLLECPTKCPDIATLNCTQMLLFLQNIFMKGQLKVQCGIVKSVETLPQVLEFRTEDLNNISDFEIITESQEKEQILDKVRKNNFITSLKHVLCFILEISSPYQVKLSSDSDKETKISIESIDLKEHSSTDISDNIMPFELKDDYKLSESDEYIEDESVFSIVE